MDVRSGGKSDGEDEGDGGDRGVMDEGVIKYRCEWEVAPALAEEVLAELCYWRDRLFAAGLIGVYDNGIGYGNLSLRQGRDRFMISGTQTGHLPTTAVDHYTLVDDWDIDGNWLHCTGPIKASSESLTHAALYDHDPAIAAVAHGHHPQLWRCYQGGLPTTRPTVPYGTPAMAAEMIRLFTDSDLSDRRVLVMAGHEDGLLAFGPSLAMAAQGLLQLLGLDN